MSFKSVIKSIVPKWVLNKTTSLFYGWSGNYKTWNDAAQKSSGYDSELIFTKVKNALLKVKNGEAAYERDSVLFDTIQLSQPLLKAFKHIADKEKNKINVLDFGGSLGSSYFQNKQALSCLTSLKWNIVEQKHFVTEGKLNFANEQLAFYYDVESCVAENNVNVVLLSSVIQYIEKPYELINEIIKHKIKYVIIDRMPLLLNGTDRITIQKVPKTIYEAQYPCWLLNENNLTKSFLDKYNLIFSETLEESINVNNAAYKIFFFQIKSDNHFA